MCVIGLARRTFHNTTLYNKSINLNKLEDVACSKVKDASKIFKVKHWDLPLVGSLKWKPILPRLKQDIKQ